MTATVYIDSDAASLGPDATQEDLDNYAQRLAEHLCERFGVGIEVEQVLGGERAGSKCPDNEEIDEYVRDFESGDDWVALLEPEESVSAGWDYEGYWNAVLGANRDASSVVMEFGLVSDSLDEWLGVAESEAWRVGRNDRAPMPDEWTQFHARALAELQQAAEQQQ